MDNEIRKTELRTGDELPATQVQADGGLSQEGAVAAPKGDFALGSAANALPSESGANGGAFNENRAVLEERARIGITDLEPEFGEGCVRSAKPLGGTMEAGQAAVVASEPASEVALEPGPVGSIGIDAPGHHVGAQVEVPEFEQNGLYPVGVDSRGRVWRIGHERGKVLATLVGRLLT